MKPYDHRAIERKWQKAWAKQGTYATGEPSSKKKKFYVLDMFPYPSGEGLHVGHPKGYIATDVVSRKKRMEGYNVLHPMGFDAFGLPAEQYALKTKTNPRIAVKKNVARYKKQLEILGFDYDWTREVNTTDPGFYRWTQWIFLKLLERGLAYESFEPINWCPVDKTGLANEDVEDGRCERCGALVEKRPMRQWVLRITDYADRLLEDLDQKNPDGTPLLDWPESIKEAQRNWIGKSVGALIPFGINTPDGNRRVTVFTTRPDTLFGATYVVLAPEHPLVVELTPFLKNKDEVEEYRARASSMADMDRTALGREKTGVRLADVTAVNPANGEEIPVFVADYVLAHYGTGAVMAVPAHDERDHAFATVFSLPIREVITVPTGAELPYTEPGVLTRSGRFDGLTSEEAKKRIVEHVEGSWAAKYKLKDWVFSRQRYWGEPIPVLRREDGSVIPVSDRELPVTLPPVKSYEPTGTGESPLAAIKRWVTVKKGKGTKAETFMRETNTMPQWAGSSWYYLRYMDPHNKRSIVDKKKERYWGSVDLYVGGAEHATRHLIYARFWHKFLYDIGVVSTIEPFLKLQSVGLIMAEDGRKMSKRYGNVVNPDDIVESVGADTLRLYELFMGPFDQAISWSTDGIAGPRRFLERVWRLKEKMHGTEPRSKDALREMHKAVKAVSQGIDSLSFNTSVSALMIWVNALERSETVSKKEYETLLVLLAPMAPHMTEELWAASGKKGSIHAARWPAWDEAALIADEFTIAIQISGKVRAEMTVSNGESEAEIEQRILALPEVLKWIGDSTPKRFIHVKGKLVNIVV
jgi:leucyl-tRNA synthetase